MGVYFVSRGEIAILLDLAEKQGHNIADLAEKAGLKKKDYDEPRGHISYHKFTKLFSLVSKTLNDPVLGLHAGEILQKRHVPLVANAIVSSRNFCEAIEISNEISNNALTYTRIYFLKQGLQAIIRKEAILDDPEFFPHLAEYILAGRKGMAMSILGKGFLLDEVRFRHAPKTDLDEYKRVFGVTPLFNQSTDEIRFPAHWLKTPLKTSDPNLANNLQKVLKKMYPKIDPNNLPLQVEQIFSLNLSGGYLTKNGKNELEIVCQDLGMKPRTLQHKLKLAGTSFSQIQEKTRKEFACNALKNKGLTIELISFQLGYCELSPFYRAFKRWTGKTPRDYRKIHSGM